MRVKRRELLESVQIVADANRLTSRAGTVLLSGLADRVGLTRSLSGAMVGVRRRRSRHDPGRTLRDLAVMLADGGDCLADLRVLRDQPSLFGDVASDATAWRALAALDGDRLAAVRRARAQARERVWELAGAPGRVILDLDATLVSAHSDKEQAAGTYKHGFGFHPLLCYEAYDQGGPGRHPAAGQRGRQHCLRPRRGARRGAGAAARGSGRAGLLVRADSGGATHAFLDHVVERGCRFSVGFDLTEPVRAAVLAVPERAWRPALTQAGKQRDGAAVAELALELSKWPTGTRAICRREAAAPGRAALLQRRQRLPLPGLHHQPAEPAARAARTVIPPPRRRRGPASAAARTAALPTSPSAASSRTPPGSKACAAIGRGPARLDAAAAAQRARPLRTEAPPLPAAPCRRPTHPPRPPPAPPPPSRLGLGKPASPPRIHTPARPPAAPVGHRQATLCIPTQQRQRRLRLPANTAPTRLAPAQPTQQPRAPPTPERPPAPGSHHRRQTAPHPPNRTRAAATMCGHMTNGSGAALTARSLAITCQEAMTCGTLNGLRLGTAPGLESYIRADGSKSYRLRYRVNGVQRAVAIAARSDTEATAAAWSLLAKAEQRRGGGADHPRSLAALRRASPDRGLDEDAVRDRIKAFAGALAASR